MSRIYYELKNPFTLGSELLQLKQCRVDQEKQQLLKQHSWTTTNVCEIPDGISIPPIVVLVEFPLICAYEW